jgi:hypothetical protein
MEIGRLSEILVHFQGEASSRSTLEVRQGSNPELNLSTRLSWWETSAMGSSPQDTRYPQK